MASRAAAISYLDDIQAQLLPVREAIDNRDRENHLAEALRHAQ